MSEPGNYAAEVSGAAVMMVITWDCDKRHVLLRKHVTSEEKVLVL
jgi:hypothetical protein